MRELNVNEVNEVSGGVSWEGIGMGVALFGLGLAIVSTGGLAGLGMGVILGAGTLGEIGVAATGIVLAGAGGVAAGSNP